MMRKLRYGVALAFMLLVFSGLSLAQSGTTGAIGGKVTDDQGSPLPGVQVKLSSPDQIGGAQTKVTNAEGKFRFVALLRGTYTLEASLPGFVTAKKDDVKLFVGQTITIDLTSDAFDAYLQLLDGSNTRLAEDDDSGGNLNARISFTIPSTGQYQIVVNNYGSSRRAGLYTLWVH